MRKDFCNKKIMLLNYYVLISLLFQILILQCVIDIIEDAVELYKILKGSKKI